MVKSQIDNALVAEYLEERRLRRLEHPLRYATRHEVQEAVVNDRHKTVAVLGGNWSGKSSINGQITAGILSGEYPVDDMYPNEPLNIWSVSQPLVFAGVLQEKIKEYSPRGCITRSIAESAWGCDKYWKCKNGSTIRFISWEKDPKSIEGPEIDVALFDEPPPAQIQSGVRSRLRGKIQREYYFFTPLGAASHLYDEFENADPLKVGLHKMAIWLNCKCLAGLSEEKLHRLHRPVELAGEKHPEGCRCNGGYKSRAEIEDYLAQFKGLELDAREWGDWLFLHRKIFPTLGRDTHVLKKAWMTRHWGANCFPRIGDVYVGLDPHGAIPDYIDISVAHPNEILYQVAELPSYVDGEFKGKRFHEIRNYYRPTKEVCKQLIAILKTINLPINDMVIDPFYGARDVRDYSMKVVDLFNKSLRELGWTASRFRLLTPDRDDVRSVDAGQRLINDLITTRHRLEQDQYMIMWSELCENSVYSFLNYRTQEDSNDEKRSTVEKPEEKHKHPVDVKRYIFSTRPRFRPGDISKLAGIGVKDFKRPKQKEPEGINYAV